MAGYIQDQVKGVLIADTTTILDDVQAEFKLAFGNNINMASNTPQGILANSEAIARSGVMRNNAEIANQLNPDVSSGIFLDSVCALMGIQRNSDTSTTFNNIEITGVADTFIPNGVKCRTENGDLVYLPNDVTIPAEGLIKVTFKSVDPGAISMGPIDKPWAIVDGVLGWGAATPRADSVVVDGTVRQTDTRLRLYRKDRLANQARQTPRGIKARVMALSGVKSMTIRENDTGAPVTIDGVVFAKNNGMWVCVDGGSDADIANAMLEGKSGGCPWEAGTGNGSPVTVTQIDPETDQEYTMTFTRPDVITIFVRATVKQANTIADPVTACQDAILSWANGEQEGEPGLVTGAPISVFEVGGAINVGVPGMYVKNVEVSLDGSSWAIELPIALWERADLPRGNINIQLV